MNQSDTNSRELRGELNTLIYEVTDSDDVVKQLADLLLPFIAQAVNKARIDELENVMAECETGDVSIWIYKWAKARKAALTQERSTDA